MPDPATQFQPSGLQAGYNYVPVETRLAPPIHLDPVNYGAISQAAQGLGQTIQNSPLFNPLVREKMRLGIESAKTGEQYMKQIAADPQRLLFMGAVQGDEFHTIAGANAGMSARLGFGTGLPGEAGSGVPNPTPRPTDDSANASSNPAAPTTSDTSPPPNAQIAAPPGPTPGQLPVEQQAKPQQAPPPVSTSMTTPSPGAMFASAGGAQAPPAPSGPDQGAINTALAQTRVGGNAPMAASTDNDYLMRAAAQKRQADLAQWQQTTGNIGGMSPKQAIDWFHGNVSTLGQDATLMQHGGPNGEPAYAFHMKGGGTNIIPLSQMVRRGGGAAVAAENTSAAFSQSDKMTGADQQPYPTIASDQGGAAGGPPPPAPGRDMTAALRPYTAVPSQGGPQPQYMMASADQAATPPVPKSEIPLHNGVAGVNQGDGSNYAAKDPKAAAQIFAENFNGLTVDQVKRNLDNSEPDNTKVDKLGNPYIGTQGGMPWYHDKETGVNYAVSPRNQNIWSESIFPINDSQWIEKDVPDNQLQQNLAKWDPSLSYNDIMKMKPSELKARLMTQFYLSNTIPATDRTLATNDLLRTQILTGRRILDGTAGLEAGQFGSAAEKSAHEAAWREGNAPQGGWQGLWQGFENFLNGFRWGPGPGDKHDQQMIDRINYLKDTWDQLRASTSDMAIRNNISDKERHDNEASIQDMNTPPAMSGGLHDFRNRLAGWLSRREQDYRRVVGAAQTRNERVYPEDVDNVAALTRGDRLYDAEAVDAAKRYGYATRATDRLNPNGVVAQERNRRAAAAAASATPTPSARPSATPRRATNQQERDALPHNTDYIGPDGRVYHKD